MLDKRTAVRFVTIVTTTDCNLRCRYCYLSRKQPGGVRWPAVRAALDAAVQTAPDRLQVGFTGGEPLLHVPLIQRAVRHVKEVCRPACPVRYVIATNGLLLGDTQAEFLERHRFQVNLSFDGVPAAQAVRGRDTFDRLDRLLDTLHQRRWTLFNDHLRVVITLTPATIPYLAESVDYLIGKDVRTISVSAAMKQRAWRAEDLALLDEQFRRVFDRILSIYEDTGQVRLVQFRKTMRNLVSSLEPEEWLCRAPTGETIAVDVDGTAYGCLLATSSYQTRPAAALRPALAALRIGSAGGDDMNERLAAIGEAARACGLFQHADRRYSCYGACGDCEFLGRCHVCPFATTMEEPGTGRWRVDDFVCAFNQVVLKYADLFPRQPNDFEILTGRASLPRHLRELLDATASNGS